LNTASKVAAFIDPIVQWSVIEGVTYSVVRVGGTISSCFELSVYIFTLTITT